MIKTDVNSSLILVFNASPPIILMINNTLSNTTGETIVEFFCQRVSICSRIETKNNNSSNNMSLMMTVNNTTNDNYAISKVHDSARDEGRGWGYSNSCKFVVSAQRLKPFRPLLLLFFKLLLFFTINVGKSHIYQKKPSY